MKQRFYTSGLVFLVILSICIFTGCKDGKESKDNKSMLTASKMSSWPNDLPKFEYGKLIQIVNDQDTGTFGGATFSNISKPETAYKNYKIALSKKGWVLDVDTTNETWAANYDKGAASVYFFIFKDGSVAQILYSAD